MRIIINEHQEKIILQHIVNEATEYSDKVLLVKKYLDDNFARADNCKMGEDGQPTTEKVVAWLDSYKQLIKTITDVQLFYVVQDKFKNIISNKEERDNFLKKVIKDWYNKRISKYGDLSA